MKAGKGRAIKDGPGLTTEGPFDLGVELATIPEDPEFLSSEPVVHNFANDGTLDLMNESELDKVLGEFFDDNLLKSAPSCTDALGCADVLSAAEFDLSSNLLVPSPELVAEGAVIPETEMGDYCGGDFSTPDIVNSMLGGAQFVKA